MAVNFLNDKAFLLGPVKIANLCLASHPDIVCGASLSLQGSLFFVGIP